MNASTDVASAAGDAQRRSQHVHEPAKRDAKARHDTGGPPCVMLRVTTSDTAGQGVTASAIAAITNN